MYKLKPNVPDFTVVDGKFEGRTYKAGETYPEIPPQEKQKFESITVSEGHLLGDSPEAKIIKEKDVKDGRKNK